jgi:hypothetical protein
VLCLRLDGALATWPPADPAASCDPHKVKGYLGIGVPCDATTMAIRLMLSSPVALPTAARSHDRASANGTLERIGGNATAKRWQRSRLLCGSGCTQRLLRAVAVSAEVSARLTTL